MINIFKIKKVAALVLNGLLPAIIFFIMLRFYNFLYAIIGLLIGVLMSYLISNAMLKNPFTSLLEGKGILAINFDSTGVLRPFIMRLQAPYMKGIFKGRKINDVWDREATFNLAAPLKVGTAKVEKKDGKEFFKLVLNEEEYNKGRFALYHYPVILWNEQTNSLLTKDFFSEKEKNAFAEHGVLYLNRKVEELTTSMLNFGRYVVEQLKPKTSLFANKWTWIIIAVVIIILIALFAPSIINTIKGTAGTGANAIKQATGGAINPV